MQNPTENKTELVAPEDHKTKMVKVRALRDIKLKSGMLVKGQEGMATEEEAKDFCAEQKGHFDFGGERSEESATRHSMKRAEVVVK